MAEWNLETTQTIRQDWAKLWLEWPECAVTKPVQHAIQTDRTSQIFTSKVILLEALAGNTHPRAVKTKCSSSWFLSSSIQETTSLVQDYFFPSSASLTGSYSPWSRTVSLPWSSHVKRSAWTGHRPVLLSLFLFQRCVWSFVQTGQRVLDVGAQGR